MQAARPTRVVNLQPVALEERKQAKAFADSRSCRPLAQADVVETVFLRELRVVFETRQTYSYGAKREFVMRADAVLRPGEHLAVVRRNELDRLRAMAGVCLEWDAKAVRWNEEDNLRTAGIEVLYKAIATRDELLALAARYMKHAPSCAVHWPGEHECNCGLSTLLLEVQKVFAT